MQFAERFTVQADRPYFFDVLLPQRKAAFANIGFRFEFQFELCCFGLFGKRLPLARFHLPEMVHLPCDDYVIGVELVAR